MVLGVGTLLLMATSRVLNSTGNLQLMPTVLLIGATVVPAAFVTFVRTRRMQFDVPGDALGVVAVCSGVIGVTVASLVEYDTVPRLGVVAVVGVAGIEEAAKLIIPVLVMRRWRGPGDGLAIGVASGAGFAALETMGYAFTTLTAHHGDLSSLDNLLLMRGVTSPAAHMAWTGLTAVALWAAASRHFSPRATITLAAVFIGSVALHTAWDTIRTPAGYCIIAAAGLTSLVWAARRPRTRRLAGCPETQGLT